MYDLLPATSPGSAVVSEAPKQDTRESTSVSASTLARALDVIDYGLLLVLDDSHVVYANQVARKELDSLHPLQLFGHELRVLRPQDVAPLRAAIAGACTKGLQKMLTLGDEAKARTILSIVPMPKLGPGGSTGAMLIFAKRQSCPDLATDAFARHHGLTPAEGRVLRQLCEGRRPTDIARAQGVAMSTVRSQIGSLREKTGSACIGSLVRQVSLLPPMPARMAA